MTSPRYFWRRVGAFIADYLIASILALLVLLSFADEERTNIRFSSLIQMTSCGQSTTIPQPLRDLVAPQTIQAVEICRQYAYGVYNGLTAKLILSERVTSSGVGTTRVATAVTTPIDSQGNPVNPAPVHAAATIALMVLLAGFFGAFRQGRSAGKALFRIRVSGPHVTPARMVLREVVEYAPIAVILAFGFVFSPFLLGGVAVQVQVLVTIGGIILIGLFFWYVFPLLRWRGRMPYDRIMKLRVDRGEGAAADMSEQFS